MESFINNLHFFDTDKYQEYQRFQAWRETERQGNAALPPAPPVRATTSHPSLALVPALREALPARPHRSSGSEEQRPRNSAPSIRDSVEASRRNKAKVKDKDKVKVRLGEDTKGSDSGSRRSKVRGEDRKTLGAGPSKPDVDSPKGQKRDLRLSFEEGLEQWVKGALFQTEQREKAGKYIRNAKENQRSAFYFGNVDLSQLGLLSVPPQLGELHQTRHLNLSYNELLTLSSQVGNLANLTKLDVSYNKLRKLPVEIFSLRNLVELNLTKNELFDLPPEIGGLGSNLQDLYVDHNKLSHLPHELSRMSKLEILSAKCNQLVNVPESLGILTELRRLDLSGNRLEELPPSWIDLFQLLREVNLSDNNLLELPSKFKPPKGGRSIYLNLSKNPIDKLPAAYEGFTYPLDVTSALPKKFPMKAKLEKTDEIENRIHKITVNTKETGIRQGLVNQSRLQQGRGIWPQQQLYAQDMVPAGRVFNNELDSIYSVEDYVREHRELGGGIMGLEHKGRPEFQTQRDVNQVESWVAEGAITYANRFNPQPEGPPPHMDTWDTGWVEPGYGVAEAEHAAGPSYLMYGGYGAQAGYGAQPGYGAQTGLESLNPELKQVLNDELQQLAPRDAQAKVAQLRNLPPEVLQAVIVEMQNARIVGGQGTGGAGGSARGTGGAETSAPPVDPGTSWHPDPAPWEKSAGLQPRKGWFRTMKSVAKNADNFLNDMFGEGF